MSSCLLLASLVWACQETGKRPVALLAMEDARRAIRTADFVWSATDAGGKQVRTRTRVAPNGLSAQFLPNDDGLVAAPGGSTSMRAAQHLWTSDGYFFYAAGHVFCNTFARDDPISKLIANSMVRDPRALGMNPSFNVADLDEAIAGFPRSGIPRDYHSEVIDGIHRVTAALETGREIIWHINPAKQWNAERVEYRKDGEFIKEMVISLRQRDGIWFPDVVKLRRGPQREVVQTWRIESATFNRPEHKQELTLSDIGVEPGMNIMPQGQAAAEHSKKQVEDGLSHFHYRVWNGTSAVTREEYRAAKAAGLVRSSPTIQALLDRAGRSPPRHAEPAAPRRGAPLASVVELLSEWEQYVRQFIARYKLAEEQSQKALTILKDCQELAKRYLNRNEAKIEQLEVRLRAARKSREPDAGKQRAAILAQMAKVREPVENIFETRLKPRLEKLPTRAQRKSAGDKAKDPG